MRRCEIDHSVFSCVYTRGNVILIVYADNFVITGDGSKGISELKTFL